MTSIRRILHFGRAGMDLASYAIRRARGNRTSPGVQTLRRVTGPGMILIVEAELPRPDRDAGSRILDQLLQSMVDMGWRVYLMPASPDIEPTCLARLKELGVQSIPAPQSKADWRRLKTFAASLDVVWLCRPLVAVRFYHLFRRWSTAQVQYYTVDLHYLREARRFEVSGRWRHLLRSVIFRSIENSIIAASDAVLCLSHAELSILSPQAPQAKLRWVPPHVSRAKAAPRVAASKHAISPQVIFVGNFRHAPNEDATRWLLQEIWPLVRRAVPGAQLHIVGANPPKWLASHRFENVQLHNGVSDDELAALYRQATVAVAPLRFGAGVKGKVLEAMEHGAPLVSTSIGLEGLPTVSSLPAPCDDAEDFAAAIVGLVENPERTLEWSRQQREYLDQHFSPSAVREQLVNVLAGPAAQTVSIRRPMRRATALEGSLAGRD